ncbi:MAG: TonB-dependent receptor [Pseudoxanthomonas sp.]
MTNLKKLPGAIKFALFASAATLVSGNAIAQDTTSDDAKTLDRIEVTGSRIKRAEIEGAVPVTVLTRAQIDASGDVSVADVLRDTTFASFGNFRPQSGSSAQSVADVDLRGIGSDRTLVLIDGRRAPYAPSTGQSADLNTIPLAAVERIEILSDGASALYGSDAIGGVINIILRKDFEGAEVRIGMGKPKVEGGDTEEGSVVFGTSSDRGNLLLGASYNSRGMVFTRDQIGGGARGASIFGNNYFLEDGTAGGALPGYACDDPGFYRLGANCVFDFNAVAANEASVKNKSLFARGNWQINDDWSIYTAASYSNADSFGRYAPTPGALFVEENSPNDPVPGDGQGAYIYHRYAAAGNRDGFVDNAVTDFTLGFQGQINDRIAVDFGIRRSDAKFKETGRGYIVTPLAEAAAADGSYNLFDPFGNPDEVIKGFTATIGRDGKYTIDEVFANATIDLFEMGGGMSSAAVGVEYRDEQYADIYDSLSEAGVVAGSAGNSAAGDRQIYAAYAEWLFPIVDSFDITLAARYDSYSDYGNDVSPKIAMRWQPLDSLTFRGSYGEGFRAPPLPYLYGSRSFSAEAVQDYRTCVATGYTPAECGNDANGDNITDGSEASNVQYQVNSYSSGNPELKSEQSKQYSLGLAWDATDWLNVTLDYYNIEIEDRIRQIDYQELVDFNNNGVALPPGTSVARRPNGSLQELNTAFANEGDLKTSGLDFNLRTRFDMGNWGSMENWLQVAYILDYDVTDGPTKKDRLGMVGQPDLRGGLRNTWSFGDLSVNWNINYIDAQQNSSVAPTYGFLAGGTNTRVGGYATNDVAVTYNAPWNGAITLGVNNIGDRYPELVSYDGRPWNFYLYDAYGRTVYMRYTQKF